MELGYGKMATDYQINKKQRPNPQDPNGPSKNLRSLLNDDSSPKFVVPRHLPYPDHLLMNQKQSGSDLKHSRQETSTSQIDSRYENPQFLNAMGHSEEIRDPEKAFSEIKGRINDINNHNFNNLLVDILQRCSHQFSLDEFFILLYVCESPESLASNSLAGTQIDKAKPNPLKLEGLKFCRLFIETLRQYHNHFEALMPLPFPAPQFLSVKMQPLLSNFLAIKVLLASVKLTKTETLNSTSLSRSAIYKGYYVVCQKLLHRYPTPTTQRQNKKSIVLGQSHLGKITKLLFKNLTMKRLGKRGESSYYYLGITWNESVIDEEILRLINLDLPQLQNHFQISGTKPEESPVLFNHPISIPRHVSLEPAPLQVPPKRKSSFVDSSSKFPTLYTPPRFWGSLPFSRPQPSQWAQKAITSSVNVLRYYNINFVLALAHFNSNPLSVHNQTQFLNTCSQDLLFLTQKRSTPTEAFCHLYLIIALVLFPVALASSEEMNDIAKREFCFALKAFVTRLEHLHSTLPVDSWGLAQFIEMLKRIMHLSKLLSTNVQNPSVPKKVNDLPLDFKAPAKSLMESKELDLTQERIIMRCIEMAKSAFIKGDNQAIENKNLVPHIEESFKKLVLVLSKVIYSVPASIFVDALAHETIHWPYQSLRTVATAIHRSCLSDPFVLKLPIHIFESIVLLMTTELQSASLSEYGDSINELSPKTFQVWWLQKALIHEYIAIVSEIAGLINFTSRTND